MTENLKRCPFCGGKARLKSSHGFNNVSCENCGTEYPVSFDTRKRAGEVWNKRPIENELVEKIEKLEKENHILRLDLAEIARGFDVDGFDYTREEMMRIAKEALK